VRVVAVSSLHTTACFVTYTMLHRSLGPRQHLTENTVCPSLYSNHGNCRSLSDVQCNIGEVNVCASSAVRVVPPKVDRRRSTWFVSVAGDRVAP
jgi:hypothetical protein